MREELSPEGMPQPAREKPAEVNPLAAGVLRRNSLESWTRPAPSLYPHQWSWDSAFIALGLAHLDNRRAAQELETLFASQWATGKLPHVVFNPEAPPRSYFPDAERWGSAALSSDAPSSPHTSGLCQPPVHAIAVLRIWESAQVKNKERIELAREFLRDSYPRLLAWHLYLTTARDPEGSGLVTIYQSHPFLVKDVLFSAILIAANEALLEIADAVEAPDEERALVEGWIERGRESLDEHWDEDLKLCLDYDLRAGKPARVRTVAGFAPLIAGGLSAKRLEDLLQTLYSPAFAGNPRLAFPLPPSTSPEEAGFHPRSYWRGPVWPVTNWLLWWSLLRAGEQERAGKMRRDALAQVAEGGFAEYFEPFTGEPLGSPDQSWTAAVSLDFLAAGGS